MVTPESGKKTLLCWKMLLVKNTKHSSIKLMEGVKINVTFLYLVRAEITTDSAWGTDQPGKACVKAVGYKPRGVPS